MTVRKAKNRSAVPDIRLAKLFNFTYEDLAANRLGFITAAQEFNMPVRQREFYSRLVAIFNPFPKKQRHKVGMRCGRVELNHQVRPVYHTIRRSVTHMVDDYSLNIKDKHFKITQAQYHAITGRVFYMVYYDTSNDRIVALERVPNDC